MKGQVYGKVTDFFFRAEYQNRGAVHYHCLIWLEDSSNLCKHVSAVLPDERCPTGAEGSGSRRGGIGLTGRACRDVL
jgi:hypothetical protein